MSPKAKLVGKETHHSTPNSCRRSPEKLHLASLTLACNKSKNLQNPVPKKQGIPKGRQERPWAKGRQQPSVVRKSTANSQRQRYTKTIKMGSCIAAAPISQARWETQNYRSVLPSRIPTRSRDSRALACFSLHPRRGSTSPRAVTGSLPQRGQRRLNKDDMLWPRKRRAEISHGQAQGKASVQP